MSNGKKNAAPDGGFALSFASSKGACTRCAGLATLHVTDDTGALIGMVVAEWPWGTDIPDDPEHHPQHPHYVVEWFGQNSEGVDLLGLRADDPYFIARAIHDQHLGAEHV